MPTTTWTSQRTRGDPDQDLVRRMADGDEAALVDLYGRYAPVLLAYLTRQLGDRQRGEELLHDVMLAGWQASAAFRGDSSVRTWLFAIAHKKVANALRRRAGQAPPPPDRAVAVAPAPADAVVEHLDLQAAIDRLPPDQRAALDLIFFHELTSGEVAAVMGVAPGTVRSWLHRATRRLRRMLETKGRDDV